MSIELDRPGGGVAAFMLSVGTLLALDKNGTLADDEVAERQVCKDKLHGDPLSISSSDFTHVLLAIGPGDSSII